MRMNFKNLILGSALILSSVAAQASSRRLSAQEVKNETDAVNLLIHSSVYLCSNSSSSGVSMRGDEMASDFSSKQTGQVSDGSQPVLALQGQLDQFGQGSQILVTTSKDGLKVTKIEFQALEMTKVLASGSIGNNPQVETVLKANTIETCNLK